jgi:hypothetical protein
MELLISFLDQSKSFTYGVEYGRLLQKIQDGKEFICNDKFPVRIENVELLKETCKTYNYIPIFGKEWFDEYVEFTAIKNNNSNN